MCRLNFSPSNNDAAHNGYKLCSSLLDLSSPGLSFVSHFGASQILGHVANFCLLHATISISVIFAYNVETRRSTSVRYCGGFMVGKIPDIR